MAGADDDFGAAALFVCNLTEFRAVWLHLLILAARWMILIRVSVAVCSCCFAAKQTDRLAGEISLHGFVGRLRALAVGLG